QGGPVPAVDLTTGQAEGFLRNAGGEIEVSRVGESLLASIARRSAGGIHLSASDPAAGELLARQVRPSAATAAAPPGRTPRYAWLAGAALLFLLVEPVGDRGRRAR